MPLVLEPAGPSDALRGAWIEHLAYKGNPFDNVLFPKTPGNIVDIPAAVQGRANGLAEGLKTDSTVRWTKVVDTDLTGDDATIAWVKYHVYSPDPPPEQKVRDFGPMSNRDACAALFGAMAASRQRLMCTGEPVVYLHMLQTDPKHQKRGAGSMLVQHVADEAAKLGLPVFIEGNEAGRPLYHKCGFEDIEQLKVDMRPFGGPGFHESWSMRKNPPK